MTIKRLADFQLAGQLKNARVFIRADLNVPQDDHGNITDDTRIRASVGGIQMALKGGAAVMVTSHLGRPTEGEFSAADSLAPIAARLTELLGQTVTLKRDYLSGVEVKPGQVVLLENCRFNKGEKKNSDDLAKQYAALCDVYVNDAFGTAHRAEASTHGVAKFVKTACAGDRRELAGLSHHLVHFLLEFRRLFPNFRLCPGLCTFVRPGRETLHG